MARMESGDFGEQARLMLIDEGWSTAGGDEGGACVAIDGAKLILV